MLWPCGVLLVVDAFVWFEGLFGFPAGFQFSRPFAFFSTFSLFAIFAFFSELFNLWCFPFFELEFLSFEVSEVRFSLLFLFLYVATFSCLFLFYLEIEIYSFSFL